MIFYRQFNPKKLVKPVLKWGMKLFQLDFGFPQAELLAFEGNQ